jgi:predicted MFS family arabinose efflux permease
MKRPDAQRAIDVTGSLLATGGLALLVYAIVGTDKHPWGSGRTVGLLIEAGLLLAFFITTQTFVRAPLMPLSLFRSRHVSAANVTMLLLGVAFFSMWYFLSLYLQQVKGHSPLRTGLLFLPMSAAIIIGAQTAGRVIGRFGPRALLVVGLGMTAGGFAWLTQLTAADSYVHGLLGATLLISFGVGLCFTPLATAATTGVHWTQAGLASGVLNTSRQVGGSIGLAALATIATARTNALAPRVYNVICEGGPNCAAAAMHRYLAPATTSGFDRAFGVAAAVCAVAALTALAIPRRDRSPA